MKPVAMTPIILAPSALANDEKRPEELREITLSELCETADIPLRVTGGIYQKIVLHEGEEHFSTPTTYYVGVGKGWSGSRKNAFYVLEVLAHGFHDYAARETICHRGFFIVPPKRGRPQLHGHAMTPKERMRKMRANA